MNERTHSRGKLQTGRGTAHATAAPDAREARAAAPAALYRELRVEGFSAPEAGNLTAYLVGIRPVAGGWSLSEIEHLLFLRDRVERGGSSGLATGS